MISNSLNFETDNSKFYDDQDEIPTMQMQGNLIPFNNKENFKPNLEIDIVNEFYDSHNYFDCITNLKIEETFFEFDYNEKSIKFKNREELAAFVSDKVEYIEPYYILNIPQKTHCIQIKMRNIESVCDYLLKFYQK